MKKIITSLCTITLIITLFTACGSKRNDMMPDAGTNHSAVSVTQSASDSNAEDHTTNQNDQSDNQRSVISEEEAMVIALKDANLTEPEITGLRIKLEQDDGIQKYEVDFNSGSREYDYEIDALHGRILEKEEEPID